MTIAKKKDCNKNKWQEQQLTLVFCNNIRRRNVSKKNIYLYLLNSIQNELIGFCLFIYTQVLGVSLDVLFSCDI